MGTDKQNKQTDKPVACGGLISNGQHLAHPGLIAALLLVSALHYNANTRRCSCGVWCLRCLEQLIYILCNFLLTNNIFRPPPIDSYVGPLIFSVRRPVTYSCDQIHTINPYSCFTVRSCVCCLIISCCHLLPIL